VLSPNLPHAACCSDTHNLLLLLLALLWIELSSWTSSRRGQHAQHFKHQHQRAERQIILPSLGDDPHFLCSSPVEQVCACFTRRCNEAPMWQLVSPLCVVPAVTKTVLHDYWRIGQTWEGVARFMIRRRLLACQSAAAQIPIGYNKHTRQQSHSFNTVAHTTHSSDHTASRSQQQTQPPPPEHNTQQPFNSDEIASYTTCNTPYLCQWEL